MGLKENLHENNFEDFIKNKINEFDESPSSNMWERIEGVIPPKPQPAVVKYFTPVSVAASIALVAILWAGAYQFQSQNNLLSKKLDKASQQIEELNQQVQELNSNTDETITKITDKTSTDQINTTTPSTPKVSVNSDKLVSNSLSSIKSTTIVDSKLNQNSNTGAPLKETLKKRKQGTNSVFSDQENNIDNNTSQPMATITAQEEQEKTNVLQENKQTKLNNHTNTNKKFKEQKDKVFALNADFTNFIDSKLLTELENPSKLNTDRTVHPQTPNQKNVRRADLSNWSITAMASPLWARSNQRPRPGGQLPPDFKKPEEMSKMGFAAGLKVNYQVNDHWMISAGISRQHEEVRLNIHEKVPYNQTGEIPFDPEFTISNHNFQANSNYGSMGIGVDLFRDISHGNINHGRPIDVTLKGFHKKTSVNIPITTQYTFNPNSKITVGVKGGLAAQLLLNNEFKPVQIEVSEEGVIAQGITLTQRPQLSERMSVDGIVGLPVSYKINDNWQLNVEPTLAWSLTNKHRSPLGNTKSGYGASQFGLTYLF